tara:strand:- start:246 stop:848 length:603 start_codon:yes stop_codon:yes gene_type:complete
MATIKASRLAAVNTIISNVGQSPLNNLDSGNPLAELAEGILDEITRAVQAEGWSFNTEYRYPTTPDPITKEVTVRSNMLSVDLAPTNKKQVVIRGGKLYDKVNHTTTFTEDILDLDIVWLVDFEDMPEAYKNYVTVRAANVFAGRTVGTQEAVKFGEREELMARANCIEYETQQGDYTVFSNRDNDMTYNGYRPIDALWR